MTKEKDVYNWQYLVSSLISAAVQIVGEYYAVKFWNWPLWLVILAIIGWSVIYNIIQNGGKKIA